MSVEALIPVDRALDNIRNFQADIATEPPNNTDAMMYLLRREHQIPTSLESIGNNLSQYMVYDLERPSGWRSVVELTTVLPEEMAPRRLRLSAPVDQSGLDARVEVAISGRRTWRLKKLGSEMLLLNTDQTSRGEWDHVRVADESFYPFLWGNQGYDHARRIHGFARGVARIAGAVADAVERSA